MFAHGAENNPLHAKARPRLQGRRARLGEAVAGRDKEIGDRIGAAGVGHDGAEAVGVDAALAADRHGTARPRRSDSSCSARASR